MQLKHLQTLLQAQESAARVTALAWSPNNVKLAVCTTDRMVLLFDEHGEKKDKFTTKPANAELGKKCYQVIGLAFSPDSTKIAVAQTDNIIFVYKIGENWGDKKVICNKIILQSAPTCLLWPAQQPSFVFGLSDGKVKLGGTKGSKSQIVYSSESFVVSLAASPSGKGILCGHADGSIVRYLFEEEGPEFTKGPVCKHPCPPYALAWGGSSIIAAGCDRRVVVYSASGQQMQQFDYSREDEKEFMCAVASPSGHSVVIGSFDRLRAYNWAPRKKAWEESTPKNIPNLYTITALAWKKDGSRLTTGSLCGAVDQFDCCLKRLLYKSKFEMTYVGLSQVIVKNLGSGSRVVLKSHYGSEIEKVDIMGNDRYLVGRTTETLLLGDMTSCKLSEIAWQGTGGNEKFFFENESVCMVFNAGELTLVEYGVNDILGSVRTEFMSPHLISARINERKLKNVQQVKKLAYLVDLHTICIMDLQMGITTATHTHENKINWLELNETGRKLLFRDKKLKLHLYDVETETVSALLTYCSYVQWVPQSDVVVAQNRGNLCVWYNIEMHEKITMFPIKGEIVSLERFEGRTEVLVQNGVETISYTLDEGLIEFGTAIDDGDFLRALAFLESLEMTSETEAMWKTLAELTLRDGNFTLSQRCYAAVGDMSKARYLREVSEMAAKITAETGQDGSQHYLVQAKLAVLNKQFKEAERILVERGEVQKAMDMYMELHRWEDAIVVAELTGHADLEGLKASYLQWLLDTGQEESAGELREREGDLRSAISLYLKAGLPARAARLVMQHEELSGQLDLFQQIAHSLMNGGLHEKAGELYEYIHSYREAMEAYRLGGAFRRAVELARSAFPQQVVTLEEQWGDRLCSQKQYDTAIVHYVEAGCAAKAIEAAVEGRQWNKAVQIVEMQETETAVEHYKKIADHYATVSNFQLAEEFYLKGNLPQNAMEMYIKADQWEPAYRIAMECMEETEVHKLYTSRAKELEGMRQLKEAEKLYVIVGEPDLAISMYKRNKQYDPMIRLVSQYHADLLNDTHLLLAKELESENQFMQAENHFILANDWKAAANMYNARDLWDDAYRVAKAHGGPNAANKVAFFWAKKLGGESAVKLLSKFGLLEAAVDYATDNLWFDFAFEVSKVALKSKIPEIHLKKALYLEDEGKFSDAEAEFITASKPKEAVLMYVHQQDWDAAQRVAETYTPESVSDVLVGQARVAFERRDYQKAETFLLRAHRPDLAVNFYKEADMWSDALRIVKDYLPLKLDEFQRELAAKSGKNYDDLLSQANTWEQNGEYTRAIDFYLQLNTDNCTNQDILLKSWNKAVELCLKFIPDRSTSVVSVVCSRLSNVGRYSQAGELFLSVNMVKEGLDMMMLGEQWDKARHIAKDIAPRYEQYVEDAYIDFLKEKNRPTEMEEVDPEGALKMYMDTGDWDRCLELASKQGSSVMAKYVALYAADLIKSNDPISALKLYIVHGAPAVPRNFNTYRRLCVEVFNLTDEAVTGYLIYANLRDLLLNLVEEISKTSEAESDSHKEFQKFLLIAHYMAARAACKNVPQLDTIVAKLSASLLRYSDIIPADKAFYEAGLHSKAVGLESMAFVFFNHFLDLSEAIEDGSLDTLDNSDLANTDIPLEIPLPEEPFMNEENREEIKEWVLALSMDQKVEQTLPVDERGTYVASLDCPHTGVASLPCVITGYPVLRQKVEFKKGGRCANKPDWNKFVMATKMSQSEECMGVWQFLSKWCGLPINPAYSFQ